MKNKISLKTAILININVMIGAGIFMNSAPLTKFTHSFGFISYLISALLLAPIVLTIATLAEKKPVAGGLYVYVKDNLGKFIGFISGWSYFLGKTTSAILLCNTFVIFFQNKIQILQKIPLLILDLILIFTLIFINIIGVKIEGKIQYLFTAAKFIPILFVIFTSLSIFNPKFFILNQHDFYNLFSTLPIAIYALLSFEIITSIGHMIEHPEKNIYKAILYSFLIVTIIATSFQFLIFGAIGNNLELVKIPILLLGSKIFKESSLLPAIINGFVFTSIIGGAFGNLTSNCWNIYALARDKQIIFSKFFTKINKNNIPYFSLIFQGVIGFLLLLISKNQIALQNMTVLAVVIAYLLSSFSLIMILKKEAFKIKVIPISSIFSSIYILSITIKNIITYGISLPFIIIFFIGILFSFYKKIIKNY